MEKGRNWLRVGARVAAICIAAEFASVWGQQTLWTYSSVENGETWVPQTVSLGNQGTQVFTQLEEFGGRTRLFSSSDANPVDPVWQGPAQHLLVQARVDSSELGNVHAASAFVRPSAGAPYKLAVTRHTSSGGTPQWSYEFPFSSSIVTPSGVNISADGQRIVAWVWDPFSLRTRVAIFNGATGTPTFELALDTFGFPRGGMTSADGKVFYIASTFATFFVDTTTGSTSSLPIGAYSAGYAHTLSGDGSILARSTNQSRLEVFRRQGNGTHALWFQQQVVEGGQAGVLLEAALADDGSTLATAWEIVDNLTIRLEIVDLSIQNHPVVFTDTLTGLGPWHNFPQDIALSSNGSVLALGVSGDQAGLAPELNVYTRDPGSDAWSRSYQQHLPGSVMDLDLSADGRRLAVASKSVHANIIACCGRFDLFELDSADLHLAGVPHAGSTVAVEHAQTSGGTTRLFASSGLATSPTFYPGLGTLYLSTNGLSVAGSALANGQGIASIPVVVSQGATSLGTSIYYQALGTNPRTLSETWVKLTVLP